MENLRPKLVFVKGEPPGTTLIVPSGQVVIGSGSRVNLPLPYEGVSRHHAVLTYENGKAVIADLGSLNGTWINGRRIESQTELADGDLLQLGKICLRFQKGRLEPRTTPLGRVSVAPLKNAPSSSINDHPDGSSKTPVNAFAGTAGGSTQDPGRRAPSQHRSGKRDVNVIVGILGLIATTLELVFSVFGAGVSPSRFIVSEYKQLTNFTPGDASGPGYTEGGGGADIPNSDREPPTTPQNLRIESRQGCSVTLSWHPSEDNIGVQSYKVFGDGAFKAVVPGDFSTHKILMFSGKAVNVTVSASDARNNESGQSNAVLIPAC